MAQSNYIPRLRTRIDPNEFAQQPPGQNDLGTTFTPEEIAQNRAAAAKARDLQENTSALGTFGTQLGLGAVDVLTAPAALAGAATELTGALTGSEALRQAGREIGEASKSENVVGGAIDVFGGDRDAFDDLVRRQEEAFPTLSGLTRIGGSLAAGFGVAGIASKSAGIASALASKTAATVAGASGGAQAAYQADSPIAEVATQAALGGALGFVLGFGGEKLAKRLKAPELAELVQRDPDSLGSKVADELTQNFDPVTKDIAKKTLRQDTDELFPDEVITPDNWDKKVASDIQIAANREAFLDAAAQDITRIGNQSAEVQRELREQFGNLDLKKEVISGNLNGLDEAQQAAAVQQSKAWLDDAESKLYDTLGPRVLRPKEFGELRSRVNKLIDTYESSPVQTKEGGKTLRAGKQAAASLRREIGSIRDVEDLEDTIARIAEKKAPAYRAAYKELQKFADEYGPKLGERSRYAEQGIDYREVGGFVKKIENDFRAAKTAFERFSEDGGGAADAYVTLDRFRRQVKQVADELSKKQRGDASALAADELKKWSQGTYLNLAEGFLTDEQVWGRQGAAQKAFNAAWSTEIQSERFGLRNFMSPTKTDLWNRPEYTVDQSKITGYLKGIKSKATAGARLQDYFIDQANLLKQLRTQYPHASVDLLMKAAKAEDAARSTADKFTRALDIATRDQGLKGKLLQFALDRAVQFASAGVGGLIGGEIGAFTGFLASQSVKGYVAKNAGGIANVASKVGRAATRGAYTASKSSAALLQSPNTSYLTNREIYEQRQQQIHEFIEAPPEQLVLSVYDGLPTQLADTVAAQMQAKVTKLRADLPKPGTTFMGTPDYSTLTSEEIRKGNAMIEATLAPRSIYQDFMNGSLDSDKAAYAWEQWPELKKMTIAGIQDIMAFQLSQEQTLGIPHSTLTALDNMLQLNGALQQMQTPENLAVFAQLQTPTPNEQDRPRVSGPLNNPYAELTRTQKIAAGGLG